MAAAAVPEMQRWKTMMETFLDHSYGAAAAAAAGAQGDVVKEGVVMEKLQELLLSLSALLRKLDGVLPAAAEVDAPPPHLHDGGVLFLASVLVMVFSLAGLLYFFFFFVFRAGGGGEGGSGGVWGTAAKALKGPRAGEDMPAMTEHKCLLLTIGTTLLVITLLGGFYYLYCYQAGCFGGDGDRNVVGPLAASAGRKLWVLRAG